MKPNSVMSAIAKDLSSRIILNDGNSMPMFGLGMFRSVGGSNGEAEKAVEYALSHGYRLVDTAEYHGTEEDVGRGIKKSGVNRKDVFVVNKIFDNGYQRCLDVVRDSLNRMDLDFFDLYCIHTPAKGKNIETYKAMVELQQQGLIRSIGVCNFNVHHLEGLKSAGLPTPTVNQIELHPWLRHTEIVRYCIDNGIALMAFSPLVKGMKLEDKTLLQISKRNRKSPAQILIRWSVQHGFIPIPKSASPGRIIENSDVFDWTLSNADISLMENFQDFHCSWDPTTSPWLG